MATAFSMASKEYIDRAIAEISAIDNPIVLECGAGLSTIKVSELLRQNDCGKLITLEDSLLWFEFMRSDLDSLGLTKFVNLFYAPLHNYVRGVTWYQTDHIFGMYDASIDALLVDGPAQWRSKDSNMRCDWFGLVARFLKPDAIVVIDDANRDRESIELLVSQNSDHLKFIDFDTKGKGTAVIKL